MSLINPTLAANSLIRRRPPSEERSPPLKLILICLLLSSEMVFRIGKIAAVEIDFDLLIAFQRNGV